MTTRASTLILTELPDYAVNAFIQSRGDGDRHWRESARILERIFEEAARKGQRLAKMKLYDDAASYLGQRSSTVRNWVAIREAVGDELIDEFDGIFTFSHLAAKFETLDRTKMSDSEA